MERNETPVRTHEIVPAIGSQKGGATELPPVFLHMGLPKTATTTLQNTLFSQHPGICYLGKRGGLRSRNHCSTEELYQALLPIFWQANKPSQPELVRSVVHAFAEERGPGKPILGSWERLILKPQKVYAKMLQEAQSTLGDVRLIITLRNPLQRLPSAYLQALGAYAKRGKHHSMPDGRIFVSFDEWLLGSSRRPVKYDYRFVFGDNLRFSTQLLRPDNVGIFLMEDLVQDRDSFFDSVLRFMGLDSDHSPQIENRHLNPAYNLAQVEFLRELDLSEQGRARWLSMDVDERTQRMEEVRLTGDQDIYPVVPNESQRRFIEDKSRELHHWLVDTFGLNLERHQYSL